MQRKKEANEFKGNSKMKYTQILFYSLTLMMLLIFPSFSYSAELINRVEKNKYSFDKSKTECGGHILLIGSIKKNDSLTFESLIRFIRNNCDEIRNFHIVLNSDGGDVSEAMKIGRLIRENEFATGLPANSKCYSSCVLLLVAGINRFIIGNVGIHRPYFSNLNSNETVANIQIMRRNMTNQIKEYLDFMDINTSLIDLMMATPPEQMKILSSEEIDFYRISGDDPNHEEKKIAERAALYGTTSAVMRKRDLNAAKCISDRKLDYDCYNAATWGLSVAVYKQRSALMNERCKRFALVKDVEGYKGCRLSTMLGK